MVKGTKPGKKPEEKRREKQSNKKDKFLTRKEKREESQEKKKQENNKNNKVLRTRKGTGKYTEKTINNIKRRIQRTKNKHKDINILSECYALL